MNILLNLNGEILTNTAMTAITLERLGKSRFSVPLIRNSAGSSESKIKGSLDSS